jgi:hypothetical protein
MREYSRIPPKTDRPNAKLLTSLDHRVAQYARPRRRLLTSHQAVSYFAGPSSTTSRIQFSRRPRSQPEKSLNLHTGNTLAGGLGACQVKRSGSDAFGQEHRTRFAGASAAPDPSNTRHATPAAPRRQRARRRWAVECGQAPPRATPARPRAGVPTPTHAGRSPGRVHGRSRVPACTAGCRQRGVDHSRAMATVSTAVRNLV